MKTMRAEIISTETIKPSSPTPDSHRLYKLSLLDKINLRIYIPIILFYQNHDPHHPVDFADTTSKLKKSLSETLTRYYPLTGRIKDGLHIDCDDEGVDFIVARVDRHLEGFLKLPEFEALNQFLPGQIQWNNPDDLTSMLSVQITFFQCGGMAIGVSMSHKIGDLSTLSAFINDWAAAAAGRSGQEISAEFITSSFPPDDSLINPQYKVPKANCVTKRFLFSAEKIDQLKAMAKTHGAAENPTRVQVVSALLYKFSITALRASSSGGSGRASVLRQMVNLRKVVVPPLPEKSVGNMALHFSISAPAEGEVEYHDLVGQWKEGLSRFRHSFAKSYTGEEWSSRIGEYMKDREDLHSLIVANSMAVYSCTSWCGFSLYKVDFGWEKPTWVTTTMCACNNNILMDTRNGDGIEALVSLEEQEMTAFEQNEEFLQYASLNPSALGNN